LPPELAVDEQRLANLWIPGRLEKLSAQNLFPVLETDYPEASHPTPPIAARLTPKSYAKLVEGKKLRILAWGDSVTEGGYLPNPATERWQAQFVVRLREQFPKAKIELLTEAWPGRNTSSYLGVPPNTEHNYQEKVLALNPDLIVSEFVNDGGYKAQQVDEIYSRLLEDFRTQGIEWVILTPHYILPSWMNLERQNEIDDDPRVYVKAVREFAVRHNIALADASKRWGRLWRQGLPYMTFMLNGINHPDSRGMRIFADSLMELF
jgi:lysophospholipase L1-like esterase